jgi:mono/diheme cytochrome c family protein
MFFRTGDANITHEGLACASCHPDGTDDGVTWSTPEGPRQTPMLAGRLLDTAPYGWSRGERTLDSYVDDTMSRLGGKGLTPADREALVIYLKSMKAPPAVPATRLAAAGASIFMNAGCASCHTGVTGTDRKPHADKVGHVPIDTPSLRSVAMTAPYFHDARYRSLEELLADPNSEMPGISSLGDGDQAALAAFLRGL